MKRCPSCNRLYVDSEQVCTLDDGKLVAATGAPPTGLGRTLGPYLLVTQLGEGGMGTIFVGRHTGLGRYVAIKVLRPELSSRKDNVARFFQEAHTINRLRHPNIVESIDLVEDALDGAYCVLELLKGPDLKTRLSSGPLPLDSVIRIGVQLADALGAVHALGVVHRDLKPDNLILIQRDGRDDTVKLIDFGVAQIGAGDAAVVGTAAYMAPEQATPGSPVDRRADVYSLGVLLFEMVTGRHPFPSATDSEYILRHAEDKPPRPTKFAPRCPQALEDIILRCLAKRPEDRFADAAEVATSLRLVDPRAGKSRAVPIVLAGVLLAGGAVGFYALTMKRDTPTPAPAVAQSAQPTVTETEPAPVAPAPPEIVEISIVSTPAGASVYRVGETVALGVTPFTVSLPRSDTPTQMRFEHAGFTTKTIEVPIAESLEIDVNLTREATPDNARAVRLKTKRTPESVQQSGEKPKKLQREGVIDPFAK